MARTVVITAQTVINAAHNTKKRRPTATGQVKYITKHYPSKSTITLASLVKGRWLDGKAQALILLLSVCDTPTFFYLSNFSAVKTEGLSLHQPSQKRTIPCPALNLPPLSKVRCCRPKKFGRLPEGLPHQPLQNRTIPPTFRNANIYMH